MPIGFAQPVYLWLLLLTLPVAWTAYRYLQPLSNGRRRAAAVIRILAMVLIIFALAGAQSVRRHHDLTAMVVVDESESMMRFAPHEKLDPADSEPSNSLQDWVHDWLRLASKDKRVDDQLGLVTYDDRPTVVAMPSASGSIDTGVIPSPRQGSRGGAAIRLGMALLPPDTARRLIFVSDGNDTAEADLLAAARQAAGAGVPIDVLPVRYQLKREVMVQSLYSPAQARQGQTAAVRVVLEATAPASGKLYLKRNGVPVDLNSSAPGPAGEILANQWVRQTHTSESSASETPSDTSDVQDAAPPDRYTLVKLIELPLADTGANRFEAIFEPDPGQDQVAANNSASAFTLVRGQGKVLILSHEPASESQRLAKALQSHGMITQMASGSALPGDLAALSAYDAVVLQNVPAEQVNLGQQALLTQYVRDIGGGLVVIGGPDSYGAGGWNHTPLARIFPVDCQIPSQLILPTGALVIVIDRSGSMGAPVAGTTHTQQAVAADAAVLAIATLYPRDMVGVVSFDTTIRWETPLGYNPDRRAVMDKVRSIKPEGGTNVYIGLQAAYEALSKVKVSDAAIKHIILLTDGQSLGGDYPGLLARLKRHHITLSTIGVGDGPDANLLTMLATRAGGKYYPVKDPRNLPQVFIKEARTIRKNLILEKPFSPQLVASGSPLLDGLSHTPPLDGLVRTAPRQDPRVFTAMLGPDHEPLLAHWQVGLGQVAAFTSDATSRWASRWVDWSGYGDFWSRMVRVIGRPISSRDMELTTHFEDDQLIIQLDATSAESSDGFSQLAQVHAAVVGPDDQQQLVALHQTGPGRYRVKVPANSPGSYLVSVLGQDAQGNRQFISGGANRPPGLEMRRFNSNEAIMRQVASITGGRVLTAIPGDVTGLFTRNGQIQASRSIRPLWRLLVWLLLPLFLLDVAVRRLSWDPTAIRAWLGLREGEREDRDARETLAALKRKVAPGQTPVESGTTAVSPAMVLRSTKSEADTRPIPTKLRPTINTPPPTAKDATPNPDDEASGDTSGGGTRRLLDAKKRAREKYEGR